jgi:hypothetical protein
MISPEDICLQFHVLNPNEQEYPLVLCNTPESFAMITLIVEESSPEMSYALICFFHKTPVKMRPINSDSFEPCDFPYGFIKYSFENANDEVIEDIQNLCLFVVQTWLNENPNQLGDRLEQGANISADEISERTRDLCTLQQGEDLVLNSLPKWLKKNPDIIDDLIYLSEASHIDNPIDTEGIWYLPQDLISEYERTS